MLPNDFRNDLKAAGMSLQGFARYTGANERTVRRWATGDQDIPPWVPVMLTLLAMLAPAHR